jgi:quercetin dioxygenase-like cupin family protein
VKILRTLAVSTALLGARLAIGAGGGATVALAAASGPTVPVQGSYPITVAAGEYDLVNLVVDFAPGAEIPLHYHGAPAGVPGMDGERTLRAGGHEHRLKPGAVVNEPAGAQHQLPNTGAPDARILAGVLLPKGAGLTTVVAPPAVGMPSADVSDRMNGLVPARTGSLLCLALGGRFRSWRPTNRSHNLSLPTNAQAHCLQAPPPNWPGADIVRARLQPRVLMTRIHTLSPITPCGHAMGAI